MAKKELVFMASLIVDEEDIDRDADYLGQIEDMAKDMFNEATFEDILHFVCDLNEGQIFYAGTPKWPDDRNTYSRRVFEKMCEDRTLFD